VEAERKENLMFKENQIKPLGFIKSLLVALILGTVLFITHYTLIPNHILRSGQPYYKGYWVGYTATMGLVLVLAIIGYLREGNPLTWQAMKARFRLRPMNKGDWLWTLAIIVVVLATYFGLGFTGKWVNSVPFLAPREVMPPEWGPQGAVKTLPGEFMGLALKGQWWVVGVYTLGWFFNIFGEEFFFRGYLLPRQELAFGKYAWLANTGVFWFIHIYQPWVLIQVLPAMLLQIYIVQARKNTWISIIQHGFVNSLTIFFLIAGVLGH
jgi:membrane protease YdiL (CAAX protease family)